VPGLDRLHLELLGQTWCWSIKLIILYSASMDKSLQYRKSVENGWFMCRNWDIL
jgi:hypothetical protein